MSDGDQSDDSDMGSIIYVKDQLKKRLNSKQDVPPSAGENPDTMVVDGPNEVCPSVPSAYALPADSDVRALNHPSPVERCYS